MNKYNLNTEKMLKELPNVEDLIIKELQNEEFQKEYLSEVLSDYLEDGDFSPFFRALEQVVKARCSVSKFCKEADISRTNLYALKNGKKKPQLETILKIFKALGFSLKVA
jgi:probable addiction module antidote protein